MAMYEAYSESKYRFAVKKKLNKFSYKIFLLSDSTFFGNVEQPVTPHTFKNGCYHRSEFHGASYNKKIAFL